MSHLVSHLDATSHVSDALPGMGADPTNQSLLPSTLVPAPMPTSNQALVKTVLIVGGIALLTYLACRQAKQAAN